MRIVQIASILACGDGVTNCVLALACLLEEAGYQNILAAGYADFRLQCEIKQFDAVEEICLNIDDIIIYHFSIGASLNETIEKLPHKKILVYHNVTPARFFRGIDKELMLRCLWGILDAENTVGNYLKCITMSEFSKKDLIQYGWNMEDIEVIPLISEFKKACISCDEKVLQNYSDELRNILFVGRIVPHKKIEDIIRVFTYYQKNISSEVRLILVGSIGYKNYYYSLEKYIVELDAQNVIFTGHVSDEELEAYYSVADLFLCMSEHEGFCMPLIEAMGRKIPVLAYAAAAVPETLGEAGILLESKNEKSVCQYINTVLCDDQYREELIEGEQERIRQVNINEYRNKLLLFIQKVLNIKDYIYKSDCGILKIGPEVTDINQWERLKRGLPMQNNIPIIIYGIGKAGKKLFCELVKGGCNQITAFCDNYFKEDFYEGVPILEHAECIRQYPHAVYIITIQKHHGDIIVDLLKSGVGKTQIVFWGNKQGFYI